MLFGVGWAVADVCPGPIAAQLGQGVAWSLATTGGLVLGVWLFLQRARAPAASLPRMLGADIRMGAVHLSVADLERSVAFYESALGLARAGRALGGR